MERNRSLPALTWEKIHALLESAALNQMSPDYVRLMEIYCVIKAGGVAAQMEAARRLEREEKAALWEEIQTLSAQSGNDSRIRALQQEIQELEKAIADRFNHLSRIDSKEAAMVEHYMPKIDAFFQALRPT